MLVRTMILRSAVAFSVLVIGLHAASFDVSSVKTSASQGYRTVFQVEPNELTARNVAVKDLIEAAWHLQEISNHCGAEVAWVSAI